MSEGKREPEPLNSAERQLAEALGSLELSPPRGSERQIWYRAGLETGRRRGNVWRAVAGVMTFAVVAVSVWGRRPVPAADRVVYVREAPAGPSTGVAVAQAVTAAPPADSVAAYLRLRDAVVRQAGDASRIAVRDDGGAAPPPPRDSHRPDVWELLDKRG